jgi:hypothetical protein
MNSKTVRSEFRDRGKITGWQAIEKLLKQQIIACGLSFCEFEKLTGIPRPVISRFISGERGISFVTACKLMTCVGMVVLTWDGSSSLRCPSK